MNRAAQRWTLVRALRAYDASARQSRLPGPVVVQIQTVAGCNGTCPMCPKSMPGPGGDRRRMDEDLYVHILESLRRAGSVRWLTLMLQNEPLLDPDLHGRVAAAKRILGAETKVTTVTNGALLSSDRIGELLGAGIDRISISLDALHERTYDLIRPGFDFNRVVRNVHECLARAKHAEIMVRFVEQPANRGELEAFTRHWRRHGATVRIDPLTNRAGTAPDRVRPAESKGRRARRLLGFVAAPLWPICRFPFAWLNLVADGRAAACCQDWGPRQPVGDLSKQSLAEVWNGEPINRFRHFLRAQRVEPPMICWDCSLVRAWVR